MKPRAPRSFTIAPARAGDGKPIVILHFGKFGQIALDADDVDRMKAELDKTIRAAAALGVT